MLPAPLRNGLDTYCPAAFLACRLKNWGVFENTLTGETTGVLSFPEKPRSVSVWRNSLFDWMVSRLPTVWPTLAERDCFW